MAASLRRRRFFKITMLCLLVSWSRAAPEKLSPRQKAPDYARSSGGRALLPPGSGQTPANVGRLSPSGPQTGGKQDVAPQQDNVQRDESVSFKEVNGESVRVVAGNYGYESPEGLPVSFKYMADENGNKASFTIGAATGGGTGSKSKPSSGIQAPTGGSGAGNGNGARGASRGGGQGTGGAGGGGAKGSGKSGGSAGSGGLPGNGDRKYLPPN